MKHRLLYIKTEQKGGAKRKITSAQGKMKGKEVNHKSNGTTLCSM